MLSGKALASEEKLESHILLAETLLGVPVTPWTGRAAEQAQIAIVLQVNYQVEYEVEPFVKDKQTASTIHREEVWYKKNVPLVDPRARQIFDEAATLAGAGAFKNTIRSLRGPNQ